MVKYLKYIIFITVVFFISIILVKSRSQSEYNFNHFDNNKGSPHKIIPNIIHYIIFEKRTIEFSGYISILSSLKFQKPDLFYFHTDQINFSGNYWNKILEINKTNPIFIINYILQPTHVYGQRLSSIYHSTDLARIKILQTWGGIYLDLDVVILKNLDKFRHYEMVIGWPKNEYMGTQILLAHKDARLLTAWLEGYKRYVPTNWYYNAGQYPTEVLEKMPHLVHRVPELFGVQNLQRELYKITNWTSWKRYYALHLLSRHTPAPTYLNETLIKQLNSTLKDIVSYILYT